MVWTEKLPEEVSKRETAWFAYAWLSVCDYVYKMGHMTGFVETIEN